MKYLWVQLYNSETPSGEEGFGTEASKNYYLIYFII